MRIDEIAATTDVSESIVRTFVSRHKIPRKKKQGDRRVFVEIVPYIAALRERGYEVEADRLDLRRMSAG